MDEQPEARAQLALFFRSRRLTLRYTQETLAEASNVSTSTIRRIEGGKDTQLRDRSALRLEEALGWGPGSIESTLAGRRPEELSMNAPVVKSQVLDVFKRRLIDVLDDTSDPYVREAAMRAAEAAARAVIDSFQVTVHMDTNFSPFRYLHDRES